VAAYPKPGKHIAIENTNGTITTRYADCPNIFGSIDTFKMERGMKGVLLPKPERFAGGLLDVFVK
jgi:hypothetical protein